MQFHIFHIEANNLLRLKAPLEHRNLIYTKPVNFNNGGIFTRAELYFDIVTVFSRAKLQISMFSFY